MVSINFGKIPDGRNANMISARGPMRRNKRSNFQWARNKLSPTCAAPITVIVLIVVNSAQSVTGADIGWLSCGLLRHGRGRRLLLRPMLRCGDGLLLLNQLHWRRVLHEQQAADQALERVTPRRHLRCLL